MVRLASLRAADAPRERQLLQFFLGDLGQVRAAVPFRRPCTLRIAANSSKMEQIATRQCSGEGSAVYSPDHKY